MISRYDPDGVILFWDSDVSNYDESTMTDEDVKELRYNYTLNLISVTQEILSSGSLLAISGPEVLGEGINEIKSSMLNDYREINKQVAADYKLPYIDMRQAFLDDCPDDWSIYGHYDTEDGEHPNDRGTDIEADLFAKQSNEWLAGPLATEKVVD